MSSPTDSTQIRTYLDKKLQNRKTATWLWSSAIEKIKQNRPASNEAYEKFVNFWKTVLIETTEQGWLGSDVLCFEFNEKINKQFSYDLDNNAILSPPTMTALNLVIQELCERNELIRVDRFKALYTQSWASWIVSSIILGPIWWSYERVITGVKSEPGPGKYVVMSTLAEAAERISKHHAKIAIHGITDNLYTLSSFKEQYGEAAMPGITFSDTDWDILLTFLEYDRQMLIARAWDKEGLGHKNEVAIKFRATDDLTRNKLEISATLEHGVLNIKATSEALHKQIQNLENRVEVLGERVNNYLRRQQKTSAKLALKQKKEIEKILDKRIDSLHTLESILMKMQESVTQREIMKAFDVGATTLQNVLSRSGVTFDSVQDTMDKLEDVLMAQNEIDEALTTANKTILTSTSEDDDELERELANLQRLENIKEIPKARKEQKDVELLEIEQKISQLNMLPAPSKNIPTNTEETEGTPPIITKETIKENGPNKVKDQQEPEDKDAMFWPAY
ncbi:6256_t:CDS:2 [Ambispora gerdemannii]|uniref:6256_t:CDS:1 n=1 Tax=Ambispora gerdemannii TaxID=144530 RepID=A0A9N8VAU1_9GLOM|nr:6256_t:CDS:2 [Ambispora gerdemannii]